MYTIKYVPKSRVDLILEGISVRRTGYVTNTLHNILENYTGDAPDKDLDRYVDGKINNDPEFKAYLYGDNAFENDPVDIKTVDTAAYTLLPNDIGKLIVFSNQGDVVVNIPKTLDRGWNCKWFLRGQGSITFMSEMDIYSLSGFRTNSSQGASGEIKIDTDAIYLLGGVTA